jgi:hypothetical protein
MPPPALAAVKLELQSDALELRGLTLLRSRLSFSFFVRAALGQRQLKAERLFLLESGAVDPSPYEAKLLRQWQELQSGLVPPQLAWAGASQEVQ